MAQILPSSDPFQDGQWHDWLASPPGRYMTQWEQLQFDAAVGDVFGFHAIQLGFAQIDGLRANRMPARIIALQRNEVASPAVAAAPAGPPAAEPDTVQAEGSHPETIPRVVPGDSTLDIGRARVIVEGFEDLPFAEQSIDLVVLPHVLEFADDPHRVLREVDRVLRPEGRVIVSGLNPISLWGARQIVLRNLASPFLPRRGQFIGLPRLRDWFKLLSFDLDRGRYGCYRPPCRTQQWLDRTEFLEQAGDRWWPICGAVYFVSAIKRVHGMRLIGPAWKKEAGRRPAVAVASPQFEGPAQGTESHRMARDDEYAD